ncbi:MAG: phytase [Isosphaeraceae bacterium]
MKTYQPLIKSCYANGSGGTMSGLNSPYAIPDPAEGLPAAVAAAPAMSCKKALDEGHTKVDRLGLLRRFHHGDDAQHQGDGRQPGEGLRPVHARREQRWPTYAAITSRSWPPARRNSPIADGSVRFFKSSINGSTWRAPRHDQRRRGHLVRFLATAGTAGASPAMMNLRIGLALILLAFARGDDRRTILTPVAAGRPRTGPARRGCGRRPGHRSTRLTWPGASPWGPTRRGSRLFDLEGKPSRSSPTGAHPNNVDVIYDFPIAGRDRPVDIAVAGVRSKGRLGMAFWIIDSPSAGWPNSARSLAFPVLGGGRAVRPAPTGALATARIMSS